MATKAPIYLKRRSRKGKKETLRDILSSDMISPPLGDFRHTIHIGSGGGDDALFGDLSFLQGKFHLLPTHSLSQRSHYREPLQYTRTASTSADTSPLLKNAFSLPVIGGVQALTLPLSAPPTALAPPPKPPRLHLDDRPLSPSALSPTRMPPLLPHTSSEEHTRLQALYPEDGPQEQPYLSHAGSLLSLHLDLGPSILDDVLQIMDAHRLGGLNGTSRQELFA